MADRILDQLTLHDTVAEAAKQMARLRDKRYLPDPVAHKTYERLFAEPQPDAGGRDFIEFLNPNSLRVVQAFVEPSLAGAPADARWQFERHGYFVADRADHGVGGKVVFNRVTGLKDRWN